MRSTRELNRLLTAALVGFAGIAVAAAYWAVSGPETILTRDDNPRLVEAETAIIRGAILDRRGEILVSSVIGENQRVTRLYYHPEASTLVGYSSLRYGVGGAEAAYNSLLRGDNLRSDFASRFVANLLHQPQRGNDIRLTLDANVQRTIIEAMSGMSGAVVVLAVPGGEVLGLASLPSFDPNTLETDWDTLIDAPDKPFFNRALQGSYQPGGTLQTPLLAAALLEQQQLEMSVDAGAAPVNVDGVELTCAAPQPPSGPLTLLEAYALACPKPFVALAEARGEDFLRRGLTLFRFNSPPSLEDFARPAAVSLNGESSLMSISAHSLTEQALGQSTLTVTPLEMAVMAAAIVNDGNAPQPFTLIETRAPDALVWTPVQVVRPTLPYTSAATARQLQDLMRRAVADGAASNAGRTNIDIGGHATVAFSGDRSQSWFIGFVTIDGLRAAAVAVVVEDSNDAGLAADIGGHVLSAAHVALSGAS